MAAAVLVGQKILGNPLLEMAGEVLGWVQANISAVAKALQ